MKTNINDDGSTSYTLTSNEKLLIFTVVSFLLGQRRGYVRGRTAMAKEIRKTGTPQP